MKNLLAKAKDLLAKSRELVFKGIAWFRGLDQKMKIIVISSAAVVLLAIVAVCVVAALPGGDQPTVPPTTTGSVSMQTTYQVSVKDASGNPYTAGVIVKFMQNGQQVAMQPVNGNGVAEKTLPNGEYTIELEFTNAANAASYDQKNAVVSVASPRLELVLMNTISGETVPLYATSPVTGEGRDYLAYNVSLGDTSVPLEKSERSFFLFAPTEAGTYRFTTSSANAAIGYYGMPHFVLPTSGEEVVDNAFEVSVSQGMIGSGDSGTTVLVIGIDSVDDIAACVLTIERVGDPAWDISDEPWTEYENVFTPVPFVMGEDASIKEFDLTASTDTYHLVFNAADGCYHLDSEDGPLVLIRLAEKSAYTESYKKMLETTGIKRYFFDDDGKFVKKEDYSGNITAYLEYVDEATGLYPLTEDLKYILQNNGEHQGWWNDDGYYLFLDEDGNKIPGINNEIAWLFMCCYDENNSGRLEQDATAPETTAPETTEPETTAPVTTVPPTTEAPTVPVTTLPAVTQPTAPVPTQPATTKPAATRPVETRPAATRPSVTVPPTTVPPTTVPPTTVPPTTAAPTTVPPTTVPPTTVPPTTVLPTTVPPTTVPPTTVPPTTVPPTTVPPTTVPPTTAAPEPTPTVGELVEAVDPWLVFVGDPPEGDTEAIAPGTYKKFVITKPIGRFIVTIQDADAYITYNDKTYYPEDGVLTVEINSESTHGTEIGIGNMGTEEKSFHINVSNPAGSDMNPFVLTDGEIVTNLEEGNNTGVYYVMRVDKTCVLKFNFSNVDGSACDIQIDVIPETLVPVAHNLYLKVDETGSLEIEVEEGTQIKMWICAERTAKGKYRAATIETNLVIE